MTNEEFYDSEIGPVLLELARKCQARKMAFVASVEYDPPEAGRAKVEYQPPTEPVLEVSINQLLVHWAARCEGNIDALFIAIEQWCAKYGHNSMYLELLSKRDRDSNLWGNGPAKISVFKPA